MLDSRKEEWEWLGTRVMVFGEALSQDAPNFRGPTATTKKETSAPESSWRSRAAAIRSKVFRKSLMAETLRTLRG
jgi:hypothetical protein